MQQYLDLLRHIKKYGVKKTDRTGTGTISVFGYQMRFNLQEGFPLLTTKKLYTRAIMYELLWFLRGETNIKYLKDNGVSIWDEWADGTGELGPVYGKQWRSWEAPDGRTIDQISDVIEMLKTKPDSRRIIVTAWNPADVEKMALPPCHCLFQFYVVDKKLSCLLYQRSCDTFLGVPFNIASYALLLHIVAQITNLVPDELILTLGNVHIYHDHFDAVKEQLAREPFPLPKLWLNPEIKTLDDLDVKKMKTPDDIYKFAKLENYQHHPPIKAKMAV